MSQLIRSSPDSDDAMIAAFRRAKTEALAVAENTLESSCKTLKDASVNAVGTTIDLAAFANAMLKHEKVRTLTKKYLPKGWLGKLGGAAGILSKLAPLAYAYDIWWTNIVEASKNIVNVSALGTLLRTVFEETHIVNTLASQRERCLAYSMACYSGSIACSTMSDYLNGITLNFVQALRNALLNIVDQQKARILGEYRVRHEKYRDKFFAWARDLSRGCDDHQSTGSQTSKPRLTADVMAEILIKVLGEGLVNLLGGASGDEAIARSEAALATTLRSMGIARKDFDQSMQVMESDPEYFSAILDAALKRLFGKP